jgi:hypothetical protein
MVAVHESHRPRSNAFGKPLVPVSAPEMYVKTGLWHDGDSSQSFDSVSPASPMHLKTSIFKRIWRGFSRKRRNRRTFPPR